MRTILIDPKVQQISELDIDLSMEAKQQAIGGFYEEATRFENGDILLVDANGFCIHTDCFDVGAHQAFAGPGLIVGGRSNTDARTTLAQAKAMVTYVSDYSPPRPRVIELDSIEDALAFMGQLKQQSVPMPRENGDNGIHLHYSLLDVVDADLKFVPGDEDDSGLSPHIEMFPASGTTELIAHPVKWNYRIRPQGIRWNVPSGVLAVALRQALQVDAPLRKELDNVRVAAKRDAGLLASCEAVSVELEKLKGSDSRPCPNR